MALCILKVRVEAHGSRLGFVHPSDGEIYSGPSRWNGIQLACKHATRSQGVSYHGNEKRVLIGNEIELGIEIPMIESRISKISDRKSTRLNSSHSGESRMPSSA